MRLTDENPGFTMVELLVIIMIISILFLIGVPVADTLLEQSRDSGRKATLMKLKDVFEAYLLQERSLPDTAGCFNKTNFPQLESLLVKNEYPVDPLPDNEIKIAGNAICGGKNEFYYIPLSRGGNPNKSFLLIADTERDGISKEGYISSKAGSTLASFQAAGSGAYEDIINEIRNGTTETAKDNVYAVMR